MLNSDPHPQSFDWCLLAPMPSLKYFEIHGSFRFKPLESWFGFAFQEVISPKKAELPRDFESDVQQPGNFPNNSVAISAWRGICITKIIGIKKEMISIQIVRGINKK